MKLLKTIILAGLISSCTPSIQPEYIKYKNLSLETTVDSITDYVKKFYKYDEKPDKNQTLEEIKQNGGDCYDYSNLYQQIGKNLGFKTKIIKILSKEKDFHQFTIIYDSTGYAILDNTTKYYFKYE